MNCNHEHDSVVNLFYEPLSENLLSLGYHVSGILDIMYPNLTPIISSEGEEETLSQEFLIEFQQDKGFDQSLDELRMTMSPTYQFIIKQHNEQHKTIIISVSSISLPIDIKKFLISKGPLVRKAREGSFLCAKYSCDLYPYHSLFDRFYHLNDINQGRKFIIMYHSILQSYGLNKCYLIRNPKEKSLLEIASNKTKKWRVPRTEIRLMDIKEHNRLLINMSRIREDQEKKILKAAKIEVIDLTDSITWNTLSDE